MKYWMLVCSAMANEPMEELGGRTPLEVAKTPFLDQLARNGRVGTVPLIPHSLEATADVACMAALGYDPLEFYTGLAPLEALAMSIVPDDREVLFRCDFVTVSEGVLVDAKAGKVSQKESKILLEAVKEKFLNKNFRFIAGSGYRNYLAIDDAELLEDLDEADCAVPQKVIGQAIDKCLPRGRAGQLLKDLMKKSHEILEAHEVNRVRVDLGENPANQLWLWGQGKRPKMPSFKQQYGKEGRVDSEVPFVRGLGIAAGMGSEGEVTFAYFSIPEENLDAMDFRKKIKLLEDFDAKIVKRVIQQAADSKGSRICVTTDQGGAVPYLIQGAGIEAENASSFDEKVCGQSKHAMGKGNPLMEELLK